MIVSIRKEHIQKGLRFRSHQCPLALCLNDMGYDDAYVGNNECEFGRKRYLMSEEAKRFVKSFDAGENMKPAEFEVTA